MDCDWLLPPFMLPRLPPLTVTLLPAKLRQAVTIHSCANTAAANTHYEDF